ncbi:MAG TPA: hypothetical protein VN702_00945 [Acetobacteraceae bacterium]|nr:hypothetical protein [Acetobacteraceae bacterium]
MTSQVKKRARPPALFDLWRHRVPATARTMFRLPQGFHQAESVMEEAQHLADRYAAVWNETDPERRRRAIAALWVRDGEHYVGTREVRGYDALEQRITGSHEKNVRDGGHRFRAAQDARALRDVVTFHWEMLPAHSEEVVATGLEILVTDGRGRIRIDYQFVL